MTLIEDMTEQNPWWSGIPPDTKDTIERDIFKEISQHIGEKEALGIIGLRRSGKTTLMKQIMEYLMKKGVEGRDILYFSFDLPKNRPEDVLKEYFNSIAVRHPSERKTYVFFDEVQNVPSWSRVVKTYIDRGYPVKFFISGSSSFNILRGAGESLIGRIRIKELSPFSFGEFLKYRGISYHISNSIPQEHGRLISEFRKYMKMGSFPESYEKDISEYLSTMVDLIFFRDIINILEIKRPNLLRELFYRVLEQSGNQVNYANLSRETGAKYETIISYMDYLEMAFLISRSRLYPGKISQRKKVPKIYAGDHSFMFLADVPEGRVLETIVFNHLKRKYELFYWHNSGEVDIIAGKKEPIAIEVSVSEEKKPTHILSFMERYSAKKGYVLTIETFRKERFGNKEISYIPAYLFLLNSSNFL